MLSWVAIQSERVRIEQDLSETAKSALLQSGSSWAKATFQGRDAVLSGKAWDEDDADKAYDLLRRLPGVRTVDSRAALIEKADSYVWMASRRNQRIRLSGFAPNVATRQAILGVTKVNFPGYEVVDRMRLRRGVPSADTWLGGVSFALKQLAAMRRGEVRLENLGLSISGEAEDLTAFRTIKSALMNNAPKGIKINSDQLTAPVISPYAWTAKWADGRFELSGYVPGEAARTELVAAAKAGAQNVGDRMQLGEGAPKGWAEAALATVRTLAKLESGSAEMKDATLIVSGVAADEAAAEAARSALRTGLPPSIKLTEQIRPREIRRAPVETAPRAPEPDPALVKPDAPVQPNPKVDIPPGQKTAEPAKPIESKPTAEAMTPAEAKDQIPSKFETKVETKAEVEAKACQATLVELTKDDRILFERASAELDAASSTTLAKLTEAVKSCPDVIVRIEGHTDIEGTAEANQALALRRAQTVVDHLVKAGVDARQLEPAGYGERRPVAANDTNENKARNRRIEFVVRPR
jgi:outer membrane protein OmpA-like peptidoglycan-associated protein